MASTQYLQAADEALRAWHSVAASEFPENMQLPFDRFKAYMATAYADALLDFGKAVLSISQMRGVGMDTVLSRMESLARQSQGQVAQFASGYPSWQDFNQALSGTALSWSVKRIAYVGADIAKEGVQKVATVGALALGGYGLILALGAAVGLFVVISSFKKRAA